MEEDSEQTRGENRQKVNFVDDKNESQFVGNNSRVGDPNNPL